MKTMLEVLKGRLPDGLAIQEAKEQTQQYQIQFARDGQTVIKYLPKTCTPGMAENLADTVIWSALAHLALKVGKIEEMGRWLDKINGRGV